MFKKIIGTAGTKIASTLIGFLIISINAKFLGADGVGTIALIILGITIILLFSSLSGGAALVYLVPRHDIFSLYLPSFIGSLLTSAVLSPIFGWLEWIPPGYTVHLFFLSFLRSLNANHSTILLGKEKIKTNNVISMLEVITLLVAVYILYFLLNKKAVESYIYSLYISYGLNFVLSGYFIRTSLVYRKETFSSIFSSFKAIFRYSWYNQLGNFLQLLNYRLGYYLIEYFSGVKALGIYSVGTRLSESIWIISKSMSTVQYARIANTTDIEYANKLTIVLFRFTLFVTAGITALLLVLPTQVYVWVFSKEFIDIKLVLCGMSVGIVSLGCSMALSAYFSGIGKQHLNTIGASIGFLLTVGGGIALIPEYGLTGAAITASLAYTSTSLYYLIHFIRITKTSLGAFVPGIKDVQLLKEHFLKMGQK